MYLLYIFYIMITVKLKHLTLEITFGFLFLLSLTAVFHITPIAIYLMSALIHELSHTIAIISFGCSAVTVKLTALGFALRADGVENLPKYRQLIVYIGGCVANLLLILLFAHKSFTALIINLLIIVYNLLPIDGFDGGRIIKLYRKKGCVSKKH